MIWLYLLALASLVTYEFLREKRLIVDWVTLFNLLAAVYYVAVPVVHLYDPTAWNWRALSVFPLASSSPFVFLALVAAHASALVGFEVGRRSPASRYVMMSERVGDSFAFTYGTIILVLFGICSLLLSLTSGGIVESIMMASDVRTGQASRGIGDYTRYVFDTAPYVLILTLAASRKSGYSLPLRSTIVLVIFCVVLYLALLTAGRAKLLLPFLFAYLLWIDSRYGSRVSKVLVTMSVGTVVFLIVTYGKAALWELHTASEGVHAWVNHTLERQRLMFGDAEIGTAVSSVLAHFDHHLVSLHLAIEQPWQYESPRLLLDWPRAVVNYIPGLQRPDFGVTDTPSEHGQAIFQGAGLLFIGYVPPGWVAMNYINGLWVGVVILPVVVGIVGGALHEFFLRNLDVHGWVLGAYIVAGWCWLRYGLGGDPFAVVPVVVFLALILLPILAQVRLRRPARARYR